MSSILVLAASPALGRTGATADPVSAIIKPLTQTGAPGCSIALSRGGKRLIERSFGLANLEHRVANSTATVYEAGSVSKQVAAAAVLLLAKDGKLALADDVRRYLPELPDYGTVITVDDLLTHRSGLRDWRFLAGMAGWTLGTKVHSNGDALVLAARQRALNHLPRAEYAYTNTGYSLAAIIVERVSGQSLAEFSRKRLFEPLGMKDTQWRDDHRRVVERRATGYSSERGAWVADMPFEDAYGAGGLLTTAGDLLTWKEALQNGAMGSGVARLLQEPPLLPGSKPSPYARGVFIGTHRGTTEVGHGGVTAGYRAWAGHYPEHRIAVAVLCNGDVNPAHLARELVDIHLPKAALSLPAHGAHPMASRAAIPPNGSAERWRPDAADLGEIAGTFRSEEVGATYYAKVENGALVIRLDDPIRDPWVLSPTVRDKFVFSHGSLRVERDSSGKPCRLLLNADRLRDLPLHSLSCPRPGDRAPQAH
ncbi:MAG: beta-lactamase family protein [Pseudomonadota bacterium]|nr:beta-lactamase family protein [Pseudomonadota bacterium]